MNKSRVTSRDVARHAGVSQTTVSFVLNNVSKANISDETIRRVWHAAHELGYVPDSTARNLARGVSSNIGLILIRPHDQVFANSYVPDVITGVSRAVKPQGYRILIEIVGQESHPSVFTNLVRGREVAGLIVILYNPNADDLQALHDLTSQGSAVLALQHMSDQLYTVTSNHLGGVRQGIEHLIHLGHRHIACIGAANPATSPNTRARFEVFRKTLSEHQLPIDEEFIVYGDYNPDTSYAVTHKLLERPNLPTAIVALNDSMAMGAISAIQAHGKRVPQDIAVIGFGDWQIARYMTPRLTTLREPTVSIGEVAGEFLHQWIEGEPPTQRVVTLETELIIRESCGGHP